jgi:monoterpene epsilon-lactone hydrolase
MLARSTGKGKDRSCIAVVRDRHDGLRRRGHTAGVSEILPFRQAPEGVEVKHLRAFVAVAEELNFGRAAARLYLSQPALSRQIRSLERLLGCELLRRSTHRVELTVAGSALLDRARPLLGELDAAIAATQSVGGELANRMATLWAPVLETASADRDIQEMRAAYEAFHAQSPVPESIEVRPVTAGGVPALVLGAKDDDGPGILYLHGGGYIVGSAYGYRALGGALVAAAGVGAIVPDYRLAPEHPFPAALEDALSAYRWLAEQRGSAGVVLAGDSAGGGLACSLLLTLKAQGLPLPAGAVLMCPAVDLTGESMLAAAAPTDAIEVTRRAIEGYVGGHPPDDPVLNPLTADLTGLPPLLIQAASEDFVLPESRTLVEHATAQGVDARLELFHADTHVFHVFWSFLPEAADALQRAGEFIRDVLPATQRASRPA